MIFHYYAFCFIVEGFSYFVPFHPSDLGFKLSLGRLLFSCFIPLFLLFVIKNSKKIHIDVGFLVKVLIIFSIIYISFFSAFSNALLFQSLDVNIVGGLNSSWIMLVVSTIVHSVVYILIPYILVLVDKARFRQVMAFWLSKGLWIGLAVGYVDFVAAGFGLDLIARDMVDFVHVGVRWHGIFGEPRDAAVTLIVWWFLLCVFRDGFLRTANRTTKKNSFLLAAVGVAFVLTFSASGLLGITCGAISYLMFSRNYEKRLSYLAAFSVFFVLYFVLVDFQYFDDRVHKYFHAIANVRAEDYTGVIPPLLGGQIHNIYPVVLFLGRIMSDQLAMVFGSGFGSVILTNMDLLRFRSEVAVPAGFLPIIINDFGLLGIGYLTWIFLSGRRNLLSITSTSRDRLFLFFCLAFSASLFHKTPYFYFLIFFSFVYFRSDPVAK